MLLMVKKSIRGETEICHAKKITIKIKNCYILNIVL